MAWKYNEKSIQNYKLKRWPLLRDEEESHNQYANMKSAIA